ncbi:MAG: Asd/ArgC dimerization domain-containing protein [Candidatus Pacearchaeota archaeon]|jgi:aspartate-semialdehyde dehydrogenase
MANKLAVGILGATGSAGVEFVRALQSHPQFEVKELYASEKSEGKTFEEACTLDIDDVSSEIKRLKIKGMNGINKDLDLICSALPGEIARNIEGNCAEHTPVISTTSAYRYESDVPILITEINPFHVNLLAVQKSRGGEGWIAPGPNCTTVGLVMSLAPIYKNLGIKRVIMSSYQAVSGGGYPLIQEWKKQKTSELPKPLTLDMIVENPEKQLEGNVIGYIPKEESKVNSETLKILGKYKDETIMPAKFYIDCFCARVPTLKGHFETVFVETKKSCSVEGLNEIYEEFNSNTKRMYGHLFSSPEKTLTVIERAPQPYFDVNLDNGMTTVIGRIEKNNCFDKGIKYQVLSNNTERGAAKGMVHVAEFLIGMNFLDEK